MNYHLRDLTASDLDSVFDVYKAAYESSGPGFLAERSYQDFSHILHAEDQTVKLGAFRDGRLLGYSLTQWGNVNPYPECAFLNQRIGADMRILEARATVIAPAAQGQSLARALIRERERRMSEAGVDFFVGLVHVDNLRSLRAQLTADRTYVVGLATDDVSLNFVICFSPHVRCDADTKVFEEDPRDLDRVGRLFQDGYIGVGSMETRSRLRFCFPVGR